MFKAIVAALRSTKAPHALYGTVVAQARQPAFYSHLDVPDTLNGRFEMMCLHIYLILRRLKRDGVKEADFSQELFDIFLDDMDAGMREAGVGDVTVPKRLQKMSRIFYGHAKVLEEINLDSDTAHSQLIGFLQRNVRASKDDADSMEPLADYLLALWSVLSEADTKAVKAGTVAYPNPEDFAT